MDDKTTLICFGDHGMTEDGNHGGGSELEMRTVMFAYQHTPFPMSSWANMYPESLQEMDKTIKQVDIAAILSNLLDVPFPYSNLGVFHPAFSPTSDVRKVH